MSNLANLDQTIFVPINDETKGTSYEMEMTMRKFFEEFFEGFVPETVEAIPIPWLKEQEKDEGKLGKAAGRVLKAWKKEEEA